ncbi:MBL fold metallo-hydrolase [Litorisediminicola beolgyonensis]|uniref:MBL fold metallo-hydrolase n=1 Tax=Litorisediminicola beolgyonensis TaxID=1173614 RepID=A0ABW3ZDZ2_9RHOB
MPEIEFVNHASVLIREGGTALLTDPWYSGPAFHKGWRLLHETPEPEIEALLHRVTHIWISHEHPDHFSIGFFKRWGPLLKERGIAFLFQKIADQRVADFLRGQGLPLTELAFGTEHALPDMSVTCLKDEFYDSLLSVRAGGRHILNLNDCNIGTEERAREVRDAVGTCDILLTQFSYAAWKGGRENRAWREEAAQEKLANIRVQTEILEPGLVIPFASFVSFAHERNHYLNDAANRPEDVVAAFEGAPFAVQVMKPGDVTNGTPDRAASDAAIAWWAEVYARDVPLMTYETKSEDALRAAFSGWVDRVGRNNSRPSMRLAQVLSPIRVFQPIAIRLDDTGTTWRVDPARGTLETTEAAPDLVMHSESLWFLFSNSFGFDTLTVNGTLEEDAPGGFSRAARSLAIENLNNLGIRFGPGLVFEPAVIGAFLERLAKVRRKMGRGSA